MPLELFVKIKSMLSVGNKIISNQLTVTGAKFIRSSIYFTARADT